MVINMKKNNLYSYIIILFVMFTFSTLTYTLWPNFFPLNKILGFLLITLLLMTIGISVKRNMLFILFFSIISCFVSILFSLVNSYDLQQGIMDAIYWFVTIMLLQLIKDDDFNKSLYCELNKKTSFIRFICIILNVLTLICIFIPSCYRVNWEGRYFVGLGFSEHAMASGLCLLEVLNFHILSKKEKVKIIDFIIYVPAFVGILQTGARTFLIPIFIILILSYKYFIKEKTIRILILPITIFGVIILLSKTNIFLKFETTLTINNNRTLLSTFSNGRSDFWQLDFNAFKKYNIIHKLFGNGFDFVYNYNYINYYGSKIWAHNDFINTLLSSGILGILLYLKSIIDCNKKYYKNTKNKMLTILIFMYFIWVWVINGLFALQHFFYSYIILYIILSNDDIFKKDNKEKLEK